MNKPIYNTVNAEFDLHYTTVKRHYCLQNVKIVPSQITLLCSALQHNYPKLHQPKCHLQFYDV